jgi:hypothetical protein
MVVGPMLGRWLAHRFSRSSTFVSIWPFIHWTIAVSFTVVAVATIYFLAPKHQAPIPCDHAGRISLHCLLDGTLLFARDLFSILREL